MKKIVVIGGGFAGSYISQILENNFDVTLIDNKDYFEFTPGILRSIVEPEHVKKIQVLHTHYLKRSKIIVGNVTLVDRKFIVVNGKKVKYDYLCICSGSKYDLPIKENNVIIATRGNHLRNYYSKLCKSEKILIVGGGLVGVELAAEIMDHYDNKKITIIHSKDRLIERNHENAITYADNFLRKKGVKIIFNEKVIGKKDGKFYTDKRDNLYFDLVFFCTGIKPNFEFMKKNFKNSLNDKNHIKVNNHLQVEGYTNIFAAGDINDRLVEKTAQNSRYQGKIVAENIIALEEGKSLKEYESKTTPLVISLGKWNGIFSWKNIVFTGFIPGIMKDFIEWMRMLSYR